MLCPCADQESIKNDQFRGHTRLNSSARLGAMRRIRTTPMHYASKHLGVTDYTVVNHTMLPKGFGLSVQE